jgi:hypothetical protein
MHSPSEDKIDDAHKLSSQVPEVDALEKPAPILSPDDRAKGLEDSLTLGKDDWPGNHYLNTLANKFMEKFKADPEKELQEPDHTVDPGDSEDIQRLQQNWCSYEVLGECYVHGMMDGEAMRYQNEKGIRAQVFELR